MDLKNLLLSVAAIAATPLFAATYYVTPEGDGSKDGSSWENAFDTEAFREQALKNTDGDVYNLAAGIYEPSKCIAVKKGTYAIINGAIGSERSVLDGSKIESQATNKLVLESLIKIQTVTAHGNETKPAEINNIDFKSVSTNIETDPGDDSDASYGTGGSGALFVYNSGYVTINSCNFYDNKAAGKLGGAAAHLRSSTVTFKNCQFSGNSAVSRGGAVRMSSNNNKKGYTTFSNCVFNKNTVSENFGIIFQSHGVELNLINCTVVENKSDGTENAAAVLSNGKSSNPNQVTVVNSTIAGNTPSQIGFNGKDANLRMVNSVIVGAEGTEAFNFNASEDFANVVSGGYNYAGPVAVGNFWKDTDTHGEAYNYASIYGTNTLNADNRLMPATYVAGASGEQVKTATAEWGLPTEWNLATDAAGTTRETGMTPGANAYTQAQIDGGNVGVISTIEDADAPKLVKAGNGVYTIEGATEGVTVYTVNGATVAASSNNTVDLSAFANGLYILKSGNAIFKVIK